MRTATAANDGCSMRTSHVCVGGSGAVISSVRAARASGKENDCCQHALVTDPPAPFGVPSRLRQGRARVYGAQRGADIGASPRFLLLISAFWAPFEAPKGSVVPIDVPYWLRSENATPPAPSGVPAPAWKAGQTPSSNGKMGHLPTRQRSRQPFRTGELETRSRLVREGRSE